MATKQDSQQKKEAPSHLLVFHVLTAGKQGENLGSDEEQIVLMTYLLYDVTNRKVVCVQPQVVRPTGGDEVCDGALTEECRSESGMTDELLLRGKPLHIALNELDAMLVTKGVHPDHSGNTLTVVTDGQLHLRLGLHAEASKKRIPLQSYFYKFCDLRKEVQKYFNTNECIKSLDMMLYYLMLDSCGQGEGLEYGVTRCQDLVAVVQCLINAGCQFNEPDVVTKGLEPAIYMNSDLVEDERVIKARGLPWQASDHDIARFFNGVNIAKGGVAVCLSKNGRRNGEALICFETPEQRELALRKHKHHINQRYVELYPGTGKEFVQIAGCASTRVYNFLSRRGPSNKQPHIVRMRGLPFQTKSSEIKEFFASGKHMTQVLDGEEGILYVYHPDGRPTGDAFVLFASEADVSKALKKHCKESIGARYIELYKSTPVEVTQVINKSADVENLKGDSEKHAKTNGEHQQQSLLPMTMHHPPQHPPAGVPAAYNPAVSSAAGFLPPGFVPTMPPPSPLTPPFPPSVSPLAQPPPAPGSLPLQPLTNMNNLPLQPLNTNTMGYKNVNNNNLVQGQKGGRKDCLHVQNLPLEANMANILAFLEDLARKATSVHIMYDMHGLPRGEAIIQMDSVESAKLASVQTSGKQIIFHSKNYVLEAAQISKEEMFSKAVVQLPTTPPTTPSMPQVFMPPTIPALQQQQQQQQHQQQTLALGGQATLPLGGGQIMYHSIMQQVSVNGSNQPYQLAVPMYYPNGHAGMAPTSTASPLVATAIQQAQQAALYQQLQQQQQLATAAGLSPLQQLTNIAPPKIANPSTVVVKGLPPGVSVSNIRAFLKGIYESLPEINIQNGPDGKPLGEVRVTFGSRGEAERAILECNQKMIGNRIIELHMA